MFRATHSGVRLVRPSLVAVCAALFLAGAATGQVSPEDHAKHHPGQATGKALNSLHKHSVVG
jgi:hypothetical protein